MLDEPTSGLDPLMQQKFFDIISEENKKGATVFFSSHILSEVQHLCNRVAIIKEGHVIKVEDIKTLREDNYKKVTVKGDSLDHMSLSFEGVSQLVKYDHSSSFFYKGDVKILIEAMAKQEIQDILIEDPSLEEIFMHYYK
jgi:ABC-2 type transport system ATP-binding protein